LCASLGLGLGGRDCNDVLDRLRCGFGGGQNNHLILRLGRWLTGSLSGNFGVRCFANRVVRFHTRGQFWHHRANAAALGAEKLRHIIEQNRAGQRMDALDFSQYGESAAIKRLHLGKSAFEIIQLGRSLRLTATAM